MIAEVLGAALFLAVPSIFNAAMMLRHNSLLDERVTKKTRIPEVLDAVSGM